MKGDDILCSVLLLDSSFVVVIVPAFYAPEAACS